MIVVETVEMTPASDDARDVTNEELVAAFIAATREATDDEYVELDVRGNDAIGI
jgi:hypothetical protein